MRKKWLKSVRSGTIIIMTKERTTYGLEDCANLEWSKGLHDFIRSGVLDAVLEWQDSALFDWELSVPVAKIATLPVFDFFLRRRNDILETSRDRFLHESYLVTRHHVSQVALQDLLLHRVKTVHESRPVLGQWCHFVVFCLSFRGWHGRSALVSGNQLSDKLLLLCQRHSLHGFIQPHFLDIRHALSHLIELLLQLLSVLEGLCHHFFLSLLLVFLLLLSVHRFVDCFDLWLDLLHTFMCCRKLWSLHILRDLVSL